MLSQVEANAARLAVSYPEQTESERQNLAMLAAGHTRYVTVLNEWFDRTMDRVSDGYSRRVQAIVFSIGFAVALAVQFDTFAVLNRMFIDADLRVAVIQGAAVPQGTAPARDPADFEQARLESLDRSTRERLGQLRHEAVAPFLSVPSSPRGWLNNFSQVNLIGLILSAVLLTVGAQFWYNALKNVLGLRPLAARREIEERAMRQMPGVSRPAPSITSISAKAVAE
jgi:hypothetical protein